MFEKARTQGFDLSAKCAVVVGCGGLGTNAAVHLCGMGVGKLILVDFDTVEAGNLNRQFFYTPADVGRPKCAVLAARLAAYAPNCAVTACLANVERPDSLPQIAEADVLLCAVDSNAARRALNDQCAERSIPLVNGGVDGFFGTAYLYIPGKTPDLERAGLLDAQNEKPRSVSSTVGVIGALQAQLAAKYLCGETAHAGKLFIFDNEEIRSLSIQ